MAATTTTRSGAAKATTSSKAVTAPTSHLAAKATTSSPTSPATTSSRADPGNDAIDGGPGLDILMGGDGKDFTNGGANANETFAGEGDDFVIAGQGLDAVFGDGGNDWEEGGDQPDLLIGDSSNLFFLDDSQKPGHDILIGQGGDDDYDMEGGDDIGLAGPGIEKVAGASGYDWEIGLADPQPQDADLDLPILPLDILQVGVRDRYNEVEALSGGPLRRQAPRRRRRSQRGGRRRLHRLQRPGPGRCQPDCRPERPDPGTARLRRPTWWPHRLPRTARS